MKLRLFAAAAALGALAIAGAANAAITVDHKVVDQLFALDTGVMLDDFDATNNVNTTYSGFTRTAENPVSTSSAPPYSGGITICCAGSDPFEADPTVYASVQGGQTATYTAINGFYFKSFSFYMGSPDSYNHVTFNFVGGGSQPFNGSQIWGGSPAGDGTRSVGYRVYYDFGGAKVASIGFSTENSNAFEYDSLAGGLAPIPEPASWALMIAGFGGVGAALRSRRRQTLVGA